MISIISLRADLISAEENQLKEVVLKGSIKITEDSHPIADKLFDSDILKRHGLEMVAAKDGRDDRQAVIIDAVKSLNWRRKAELICADGKKVALIPDREINQRSLKDRAKELRHWSDVGFTGRAKNPLYNEGTHNLGWAFKRADPNIKGEARFVVFYDQPGTNTAAIKYIPGEKYQPSPEICSKVKRLIPRSNTSIKYYKSASGPEVYWVSTWLIDKSTYVYANGPYIESHYLNGLGVIEGDTVIPIFSGEMTAGQYRDYGWVFGDYDGQLIIRDSQSEEKWSVFNYAIYEVYGYFRFLNAPDFKIKKFGYFGIGGS
jgi:hypothetical protein